ncbi:acyltransferase [Wenyingzhuangia sp. chi5]|uniref:Acyltransferase n=1 Tax=Wenyingzhuangia gilva TaxID=3057677 RepID=A0ABT8VPY6_9FLAO|nr:acyltransferase [Wenyingzhuangia sp. chi5]MDO3694030.1 acyltransferase [Wenyingzhuangia sp. chi5]
MNKININNFDFLRFIFAFTVAFSHLITLSELKELKKFDVFFDTHLAINGFFIISGFLISKSFTTSSGFYNYTKKRLKRILPAYIFIIFTCAILFSFISSISIFEYFTTLQFWKYLGANLIFQNYLEPCLPGVFTNHLHCAINGSLWTIKIEEMFYFTLPIFFWLIRNVKINFYLLSAACYIVSISYYNYFCYIDMYNIAKQFPGALAFFLTGIILHHNYNFFYREKNLFILPCLILFFLEKYMFNTQILKPITLGIIIFYLAYDFKFFNNFGKYGDFTYGIYIYHFPIIQLFIHYDLYNKYNSYLISLATLILIIILSVFSWYFIELPFLSKNRKLRQKKLMSTQ